MGRLLRFLLPLVVAIAAPAVAMAQSVEPVREGDRTLGSATAPVTLTVYLSATCSHCAAWHNDDFPAFKAKYVDSGQVRIAYRDLPTPPQRLSVIAATMARCAPEDRYDDVLDGLFKGQAAMYAAGGPASREAVVAWLGAAGTAGGMTPETMTRCAGDAALLAEVEARGDQALAEGVNSTPSFFINGQPTPATMQTRDVSAFDPLIQPLLAGR
jgi:protein-disulfide isomerase